MALIQVYAGRAKSQAVEDEASHPMTADNMAHYERVHNSELPDPSRYSMDSGHNTPRSETLCGHSRSPSVESENQKFTGPTRRYTDDEEDFNDESEKHGFLRNTSVDRFFARYLGRFAVGRPLKWMRFFYVVIERTILVQGFIAFATGTVVYGGVGVSDAQVPPLRSS